VLVVDFDDFKEVNDQFGHAVGDDVLQTWSTIVTELLPDGDLLARLAGNKFAVASSSATTVEDARYLAQRICDVTAQPMNIGDDSIPSLAVSVGVALSVPESRADRLIRNADVAVYAAKENGSAQIELFDDSYHDMVRERNNLRIELAKAVSADEIMAYFQPEVDLRSGAIVGFEALARWHHRERGAISPEEFIPLAEQSGLIGRIGVTMLEASCRALRHWEELSPGRGISMAVNVSALQLLDPLFPDAVREICAHVGVNPEHLCLELTESALIEEAAAFHALNELKGVGVKIALDDFGTGYSSLRRLNRYPLDFLKIDQSFVSELKSRQRDSVIITAVMGIARALSFETVGEGIETELQRRRLIEMDCRVGQGFLFSEAVPLEAATALIANDVHYELEGTTA
jgi:diguanylate cyclase (GGDEF)-like protein